MRISIRHVTRYQYDPPTRHADLRLRLFASDHEGQRSRSWAVSVNGAPAAPQFVNGFGDAEAVWRSREAQAELEIVAEGVVDTIDTAGVLRGHAETAPRAVFLRQTALTAPNDALRALAQDSVGDNPLDTLHRLSAYVRDRVNYVQRVTGPRTTAAEALAQGEGVCQDHAQVFIAAARTLGVPARYVMGYLSPGFVGAQESHAWAEAFVPDLGWVGFDASNGQCPTEAYVRLCCGLDAADAAPLRGWVSASVREALAVTVEVAEVQAQQQ